MVLKQIPYKTGRNIIKNIALLINNNEREINREAEFYRQIEKLEFLKTSSDNDIYFYSFALNNNIIQASGHINLSSFNKVQFKLELKNPELENLNYRYDIDIYINYYNIIEYSNGIGAIKYAN